MNRQLRRGGGIMTVAPREKFGLGSSLKKAIRKFIPNEVSKIAVKAAPFVAPFNPAVAGVMAGLGSFDQTGRIGKSLKAGALTYGGGQLARYVGGAGFQDPSLSAFTPSGFRAGFSSPIGTDTGLGKMFSDSAVQTGQNQRIDPNQLGSDNLRTGFDVELAREQTIGGETGLGKSFIDTAKEGFTNVAKDVLGFEEFAAFGEEMDIKNAVAIFTKNPTLFIGVPTAMAYLTAPKQPEESEFDFGKRKEIVNSYLQRYYSQANPTKTAAEVASFVSDNTREYSAKGGRIGFAAGSGGYGSFKDFIEDTGDEEIMDVYIDVLEGIQPEEALFKLLRKKGYKTYAQGGRVGLEMGGDVMDSYVPTEEEIELMRRINEFNKQRAMLEDLEDARENAREDKMGGGIMGLGKIPMGTPRVNEGGVTELDYRAEGGFVPVGIKEKADDVPAMLSKNEFVMTADAVRAAGNGSIEKGAQKMYDTMKQLESRVV